MSHFFLVIRIFLVVLFTSTITILYAQETIITSDSLKDKSIAELAKIIADTKDENLYERVFQEDKTAKENLQNYIDLGTTLYNQENYKLSIIYFSKASRLAEEVSNSELLFLSTIWQSHCYLQIWRNEKAIEAYFKALTIAKNNANIDQEIIAYSGLISILPLIGKEDKAVDFSLYTLTLIQQSTFKNKENHVRLLTTIADAYLAIGDYDTMLTYVDLAIKLSEKLSFTEGLLDLYVKKGKIYHHKKQWNKAFEYLNKAIVILDKGEIAHDFFPMIKTNYTLACCHYDLKEYKKAIPYLLKIISSLKEDDLEKLNVIDTHYLLAKTYVKIGDTSKAIEQFTKVIELKDRTQHKKEITINAFHEQDSEELLTQIEGLRVQHKRDEKLSIYMLVWIVIILVAFFSVTIVYTKKQQANKIKFKKLIEQITALEFEKDNTIVIDKPKKHHKSIVIDDDTIEGVIRRLDKLEMQEYFLNVNCNLRSLAKKVKTNATYLSHIIRSTKGKNFNDYINDLKIDYALKKLKNDKRFRSFSVKGIATELGYKSDYSFAKHFKIKTGLNPSYYIKEINKIENSNGNNKV